MGRAVAISSAIVGFLLLSFGTPIVRAQTNPLRGAWQVQDMRAGLYIFGETHYSMMAASTDRPDITDLSKATREELLALYGPMLGNAGTYEVA
jgi:ascorbate-specific PTS system EIIC-type component UlaA